MSGPYFLTIDIVETHRRCVSSVRGISTSKASLRGATSPRGGVYIAGGSSTPTQLYFLIMNLFKTKFRIDPTRLPGWDYGQAGYYYFTICTKDREHFFGEIAQGEIQLSSLGEIVAQEWAKTETIRANVKLDEWIIMPNHMHMILVITHKIVVETPRRGVSTERGVSTDQCAQTKAASEKWAANSLGSIIGQFKGKCTKRIRNEACQNFAWQSRYYDHIIRSDEELHKIRNFIASNPLNWHKDINNISGLYM